MKNFALVLFTFLLCSGLYAQNTVGLLSYNIAKSQDGYNLIYPHNQPNVYLLDNCGEVVHVWEDDENWRPGNTAYIMPNGNMIKAKRDVGATGSSPIWAGGGGAIIEVRDWDNNLIASFERNDEFERLHHDFTVTGDNTILMIVWELKTLEECLQAGRDTSTLAQAKMWPDKIVEWDPATDEIIWEWHTWDHLVQDFDETKDNFGVVADSPQKVDVNYDTSDGHPDWMHANSIDYQEANDLIVMSVPTFSEAWIIDHSTSTEEAAGSTGGFGGRGGDLLYRWGNPQTYDQGDSTDQKLFFPHDIHFIDDFLTGSNPNFGKIGVFNNRVGADFSTANIWNQEFDMYKFQFPFDGDKFGPDDFDLTLLHPVATDLFSSGLSSLQVLANGNFLICSGRFGYTFELTPDNEIVWEYKTPIRAGAFVAQGDVLEINNNLTFRLDRYPVDYAAFEGRDLTPQGSLVLDDDPLNCEKLTPTIDLSNEFDLQVFPNPADNMVTITWEAGKYVDVEIMNQLGRNMVEPMRLNGGRKYFDTSDFVNGIYIIRINNMQVSKFMIAR